MARHAAEVREERERRVAVREGDGPVQGVVVAARREARCVGGAPPELGVMPRVVRVPGLEAGPTPREELAVAAVPGGARAESRRLVAAAAGHRPRGEELAGLARDDLLAPQVQLRAHAQPPRDDVELGREEDLHRARREGLTRLVAGRPDAVEAGGEERVVQAHAQPEGIAREEPGRERERELVVQGVRRLEVDARDLAARAERAVDPARGAQAGARLGQVERSREGVPGGVGLRGFGRERHARLCPGAVGLGRGGGRRGRDRERDREERWPSESVRRPHGPPGARPPA